MEHTPRYCVQEQVKGLEEMGHGHLRGTEEEGGGLNEQTQSGSLLQAEAALGWKVALSPASGSP